MLSRARNPNNLFLLGREQGGERNENEGNPTLVERLERVRHSQCKRTA